MRPDLRRQLPPGLSYTRERNAFLRALAAVSALSLLLFLSGRYLPARKELFSYRRVGGQSVATLIPGAQLPDLLQLLDRVLDPLLLLLLFVPFWVLLHYRHYRRGSMSIYLMRRLPDRTLLHRQCWTLPLVGLVLTLGTILVLLLLYALIYILATPAVCLPPAYRRLFL